MNETWTTIICSLISVVVLPLIGLATDAFIKWIKTKTNNEKVLSALTIATTIITNAVKSVCQTYVDEKKKNNCFCEECQAEALQKAKDAALEQMSEELKSELAANYGDLDKWLTTMIEATINSLKNDK